MELDDKIQKLREMIEGKDTPLMERALAMLAATAARIKSEHLSKMFKASEYPTIFYKLKDNNVKDDSIFIVMRDDGKFALNTISHAVNPNSEEALIRTDELDEKTIAEIAKKSLDYTKGLMDHEFCAIASECFRSPEVNSRAVSQFLSQLKGIMKENDPDIWED